MSEGGAATSAPVVRRADVKDVRFMRDMLHHAFYARETALTGEEEPVYRYVIGWGREGDAGVIALDDGFPVGAAWYRLFSADEPGYGFVDERTPELAIAVVPSRRGRGIGELMLSSLLERATRGRLRPGLAQRGAPEPRAAAVREARLPRRPGGRQLVHDGRAARRLAAWRPRLG